MNKLLQKTAYVCFLVAQSASAQVWTPKTDIPNTADYEARTCFSVSGKAYFGGGLYSNNIMEYDTAANSWTDKTTMPGSLLTCRAGAISFTINDTGYIGFGYDEDLTLMAEYDLSDLWQYNKAANSWIRKQSFPSFSWYKIPGNSFVIDGNAYLAGGYDSGTASKQLWQYNAAADKWSQKHDLPVGVYSAVTFSVGGKGYLAFCTVDSGNSTMVYEYDATSDSWARKNDIPAPIRLGPVSFVINGIAYVGMGANYAGGRSLIYSDIYKYNQGSDSWVQADSTPVKGNYIAAVTSLGDRAFIGYGKNMHTNSYTNEWYEVTSLYSIAGIGKTFLNADITCYPNPAKDAISLSGMAQTGTSFFYRITNAAGVLMKSGLWSHDRIDIASLPPGHYFLELHTDTGKMVSGFEKM